MKAVAVRKMSEPNIVSVDVRDATNTTTVGVIEDDDKGERMSALANFDPRDTCTAVKVAMPEGCHGYRVEHDGQTAVAPVLSHALQEVGYYG